MGAQLGMLMAHVQHGMPKFVLPAGSSHKSTAKCKMQSVCLVSPVVLDVNPPL